MTKILWTPPKDAANCAMGQFIEYVEKETGLSFTNYLELHRWSIEHNVEFWDYCWQFCQIRGDKKSPILLHGDQFELAEWFSKSTLNYAENCLIRADDHVALIALDESGNRRQISYAELQQQVAILQDYLLHVGVRNGDRIVGYLPNTIETVVAMLATTSIGAIWSSCSPDFGLAGLIDRFGQIEPKICFTVSSHHYNGKQFDHSDALRELPKKIPSLEKIITLEHDYPKIMQQHAQSASSISFKALPFNHPAFILYSSGTTGKPKCMVHGAGGTLLQHKKELMLHTDLTPYDTIFFYTTCGWMMWNWLISSLSVGATLVLYEGSPFYPKPTRFFDLIDNLGITIFGVGAKFFESCEKQNLSPIKSHDLSSLKTILTTGSPLLPESFDYIYEHVRNSVRVSSISGGSDLISCFALGNPLLPVYRGQLQCFGLGMAVDVFNESGESISQQKGELVCTKSFPSKPIYFWNDADGQKYHQAYFSRYENVWAHGDFAEITGENGLIIYGRSDAVLNPGGIRIGTAEIYNQMEKIDEVLDSLAIGQEWQGSERIILFVVLRSNHTLNDNLIAKIKKQLKENCSPHHVPAKIIAAPDLPRTINNKLVEIAVKKIVHREPVKNIDAIANPESLKFFEKLSLED